MLQDRGREFGILVYDEMTKGRAFKTMDAQTAHLTRDAEVEISGALMTAVHDLGGQEEALAKKN